MPFTATNDSRSSAIHRESLHASSHEQSHGHGHGHGHGHASSSIIVEDGDFPHVPALTTDENAWYYPSHGYGSSDDDEDDYEGGGGGLDEDYYAGERLDGVDGDVLFSSPSAHGASDVRKNGGGVVTRGNWGNKHTKRARWARRGKIAAWGPGMEDWQAEERARKRLKLLLPPTTTNNNNNNAASRRSPSLSSPPTPTLPHLRSPSPPLEAPYAQPATQHNSYVSFVLDKSTTHTFRSRQLLELENATTALIEGEALLRGALGRLWQVLNDDPDRQVYMGAMSSVGLGLGLGPGGSGGDGGGDGGLGGVGNGGPGAYVNGGMYVPPAPGAGGAVVPKREEEEEQQQQQQQQSQSQQQKSPEEQQQQQSQAPLPPPQQQQPIIISEDQPMLDLQEPDDEVARRLARAPDLTPTAHKLFLTFPTGLTTTAAPTVPGTAGNSINITTGTPGASSSSTMASANGTGGGGGGATGGSNNAGSLAALEPSQFAPPEGQLERLEKALATLRELQDDGREYVERLEEIREGLSAVRAQRDVIWKVVRETAIKELQEESGMVTRG